jgi:hypothetical protein
MARRAATQGAESPGPGTSRRTLSVACAGHLVGRNTLQSIDIFILTVLFNAVFTAALQLLPSA